MRTSSYTIYADLPDRSEVLLIHGYSGAHDVVSRDVANYLRANETVKPPKPMYGDWTPERVAPHEAPSGELMDRLRKRGYLTDKTPEEEAQLLDRIAAAIHARNEMPSYVVMTTYDCNLRCHYCFQDHMRTDPAYAHLLKTMTPALSDQILAALPTIEARHEVPADDVQRSFLFFGGEPLLAAARPNIEYFMKRAQDLAPSRFRAISNATELDAYAGLLGRGGIEWFQITLDGPPDEHDRRRIRPDGTGSWDEIARNITFILEQGATVSVRMNVDRTNVGQLDRLAEEMERHGWLAHPRFSANVAAVHAANDKTQKAMTFDSYQLGAELRRLAVEHPLLARFAVPVDGPQEPNRECAERLGRSARLPASDVLHRTHVDVRIRSVGRHLRVLGAHGRRAGADRLSRSRWPGVSSRPPGVPRPEWPQAVADRERGADRHRRVAQSHDLDQLDLSQVPLCAPLRWRLRCTGAELEGQVPDELLRWISKHVSRRCGRGLSRARTWRTVRGAGFGVQHVGGRMASKNKMKTLALEDLDIAELERRLELAHASVAATNWGCDKCAVDCPAVCDQYLICSADVFKS